MKNSTWKKIEHNNEANTPKKKEVKQIKSNSDKILDIFLQKKSINEDFQNLWLKLFHIANTLKKTWLEETLNKKNIDNDSYRCFIEIYEFIHTYDLHDIEQLANYYKELYINSESKIMHINEIKREQIIFLKKTFEHLLWDIKGLKEKIKNKSLIFIKENAFRKPESVSITHDHKQEMRIFLHEFPSRLNTIDDFLTKIYALWSYTTKEKLEEYKNMKDYL